MAHRGCCAILHLREDNARFILLFIVMTIYMLVGATVFMFLERDNEKQMRSHYYEVLEQFIKDNPDVNTTKLAELLKLHETATAAGILKGKRPRWDFPGSFYFVGTVVSTIGFGMTTPQTLGGRIVLIFYGFLGCAGAILFFNLFLERIITFLAYTLRYIHEKHLWRKGVFGPKSTEKSRRSSQTSDDDNLDSWKPPVYMVMIILCLAATVVACCASAMYQPLEEWSYFESLYFCFVAFSTIGFGDYVVSQAAEYDYVHLYRFGNFCFLVVGCCCIYSLFNVTSIVIKQFLNWLIKKLDCRCCYKPKPRPRRNAITPGHLHKHNKGIDLADVDSNYDSDCSRRGSNEMISMRGFLQCNKISLAMMQKQLYETAQRGASRSESAFQGPVGPLAILNHKLGQDDS